MEPGGVNPEWGSQRERGPFRPPNQGRSGQDGLVPFTFVCISISLLLVPDFASSQGVGGVLCEEGDHVAAGGSQGGVQRGGYAELNQRPVMGGGTDGSEGAVAPKKGAGGCSEATGDKMKAWDAMAGPIVTIRLWWLVTDMGSVAARSVRTTPEGLAEPGRCGLPLPSSASQPVEQAGSQMSPGSRHTTRMSEEPGEDSRCPGSQISIKLTGLVGPF